jgi:two-component system, LytTR family, response regulator
MKEKLKALIVDDEEQARKLLKMLLQETMFVSDILIAQSAKAAHKILAEYEPDLIFLDIKMPDEDGFAIAKELSLLNQRPGIVFVTAFEQYALQAIKHHAFDYLLKPVNRNELRQCILKYIEGQKDGSIVAHSHKSEEADERIPRIKVNTRSGTIFINPSQILYCQADGNYTIICTGRKKQLCSMNLGKVEENLPSKGFIRVGRSFILNFEYVTVLDRKESKVTLERNGESVSIKIPKLYLKELDKA